MEAKAALCGHPAFPPVIGDVPGTLDEVLVALQHVDKGDEQLVRMVAVHYETKEAQQVALIPNNALLGCYVLLRSMR